MKATGPRFLQRLLHFYNVEIWRAERLTERSPRGLLFALLRIVSITLTGMSETKVASRAAALSFSSLLGLGPLVAIAVLVAGFVLDRSDPDLAVNTLNRVIKFVAPQVAQYEEIQAGEAALYPDGAPSATVLDALRPGAPRDSATAPALAADGEIPVNPELVQLIDGFIAGSRSSTAGIIGVVTLILIVLQLFTSVEQAFNDIWGVKRGRSWLMRIVFYWTVLTLGSVLFFAAVTTLSAGAYVNFFAENVPFGLGDTFVQLMQWMLPPLSVLMLIGVLTLFYRCIPNTRVLWGAALFGAVVVAILVVGNNYVAFLYLSRVVQQKSLFGSLGILPILMFGLYIFWLFVLLGGLISYAVQNVHYRNSQAAWNTLAESMRERLSLSVLLTVGRRFQACLAPLTASEIATTLGVPNQVMNECLNRLVEMGLLTPVPPEPGEAATDNRFQPARPLSRITLGQFKTLDDNLGSDPAGPNLHDVDPLVREYDRMLEEGLRAEWFETPLDRLMAEHPVEAR